MQTDSSGFTVENIQSCRKTCSELQLLPQKLPVYVRQQVSVYGWGRSQQSRVPAAMQIQPERSRLSVHT